MVESVDPVVIVHIVEVLYDRESTKTCESFDDISIEHSIQVLPAELKMSDLFMKSFAERLAAHNRILPDRTNPQLKCLFVVHVCNEVWRSTR